MLPYLPNSKSFKSIALFLCCLIVFSVVPMTSPEILQAAETYEFAEMWPEVRVAPRAVAIDSSGNRYVPGWDGVTIAKFDSQGTFITEWGSYGSGDGQFMYPNGIAIDSGDNVYVADMYNHRIQKFDSTGGFLAKWGGRGSGDGQFISPHGIAIDSGDNVYVADTQNHRIQKFDSTGGFLAKWGGRGSGDGQFNYPEGIAIDSNDNVYTTDMYNHRIQKFDSTGGFLAKWGDRGSDDGQFMYPHGIAIDSGDNVYVVDYINYRIQKFDSVGGFLAKWGGRGSYEGQFNYPQGIAIDSSDSVHVGDSLRFQKFDTLGNLQETWGRSYNARAVAVAPDGNIYVADGDANSVIQFDQHGQLLNEWGGQGNGAGQFNEPNGVAIGPAGNIYVADTYNNRVQKFDSSGGLIAIWGSADSSETSSTGSEETSGTSTSFSYPRDIAVDSNTGHVYVAETRNNRIKKLTSDGDLIAIWGSSDSSETSGTSASFSNPRRISVDPGTGDVYVLETWNNRIKKLSSEGEIIAIWGGSGETSMSQQFSYPEDLDVDANGNVYVMDTNNNWVQKFDAAGQFITKWGNFGNGEGQFDDPRGIGVSASGENVYVADTENYRIQKFSWVDIDPTGRVIDEVGNPIANARVLAYRTDVYDSYWNGGQTSYFEAGWATNWTMTDQYGEYLFSHQDLPQGTYKFRVIPPSGYVSEWWHDKWTYGAADSVTIGASALQVDFTVATDNEPPTGAILINSGDSTAGFSATTLTLTATDTISGVSRMRFREEGGAWSPLEPYEPSRVWMFSGGAGPRSVSVQFVDNAGNFSEPITDAIEFAPVALVNISSSGGTFTWNGNNYIRVLGGHRTITISVDTNCDARRVQAILPGSGTSTTVDLVETSDNHWETDVTVTEEGCIFVRVFCWNGHTYIGEVGCIDLIDPSGYVTDNATGEPVEGATVTLYRLNPDTISYEMMDPAIGDNSMLMDPDINPQYTDSDGHYAWDVAPGTYYVSVEKDGYADVEQSRVVVVPPPVTDLDIELSDNQPPSAPVLSGEAIDPFETNLSWTEVSDSQSGIGGYTIIDGETSEPLADTSVTAHTFAGLEPGETYSYFIKAYDRAGNMSDSSNLISVTTPMPTTISYTGDESAQYSDLAQLAASLTDSNGDPVVGKEIAFTLGTQAATGTTDASGSAQATIAIDQPAGSKVLNMSFDGNGNYLPSSSSEAFVVATEDTLLNYFGEAISKKDTTATLRAQLSEPDVSVGDLSGKEIVFTITDGTNNQIVSGTTDSSGVAEISVGMINPSGLYDISAAFEGDQYHGPSSSARTPFVIWEPGPHINGGGWLLNEGKKTNFGFTAKYTKDSNVPLGQLQVVDRSGATDLNIHAEGFNWLVATADDIALLRGSAIVNGQTSLPFELLVSDNGAPGKGSDTFELNIFGLPPISGVIDGGNIVVR